MHGDRQAERTPGGVREGVLMTRLALLLTVVAIPALLGAQDSNPEPISYVLSFPAPHSHYVEVEATYPCEGGQSVELMMAVWTPGSYLVREYSRHVENLHATSPGGVPLSVEKSRKNRWRVATVGSPKIIVRYRVYCREMSVRMRQ